MPENIKYTYCTVFDKNFLAKALALYNSVSARHKEPFRHFVLCLDKESYEILVEMNLPNVRIVKLSEIEDKALLEAKSDRSFREYCWTLSSVFTDWVLQQYNDTETISYLDADLYFFESPESVLRPLLDTASKYSIIITPHNLPDKEKSKERAVGKYNVGMVSFKNDTEGRSALNWWSGKCIEWCYDIVEPDRYADQKYLDRFPEMFAGTFITTGKGIGLAPWNIKNFKDKIQEKDNKILIDKDPLIYFHFSSFNIYFPRSRFLPNGSLTSRFVYIWPTIEKKLIYRHYFEALYNSMEIIRKLDSSFIYGVIQRPNLYKQIIEIITAITIGRIRKTVLAVLPEQLIRFMTKAKIKVCKR